MSNFKKRYMLKEVTHMMFGFGAFTFVGTYYFGSAMNLFTLEISFV